jgi:hypothetical protein
MKHFYWILLARQDVHKWLIQKLQWQFLAAPGERP